MPTTRSQTKAEAAKAESRLAAPEAVAQITSTPKNPNAKVVQKKAPGSDDRVTESKSKSNKKNKKHDGLKQTKLPFKAVRGPGTAKVKSEPVDDVLACEEEEEESKKPNTSRSKVNASRSKGKKKVAAISKTEPQGPCHVLELPAELRVMIYRFLLPQKESMIGAEFDEDTQTAKFTHDFRTDFKSVCNTGMLTVNRQTNMEFVQVLYAARAFQFSCGSNVSRFCKQIGPLNSSMITSLSMGFPYYYNGISDAYGQYQPSGRRILQSAASNHIWRATLRTLHSLPGLHSLRLLVSSSWNQKRRNVDVWLSDMIDREVLGIFNELSGLAKYEIVLQVSVSDWHNLQNNRLLEDLGAQAKTFTLIFWKMNKMDFIRLAPIWPHPNNVRHLQHYAEGKPESVLTVTSSTGCH